MNQSEPQILLILSVPPALEEPLVDWLLEEEPDLGFTSTAAYGHGSLQGAELSISEQVRGKQRRVQFHLLMSAARQSSCLGSLQHRFPHADVHYWVLPVMQSGRISEL